MSSIGAILVVVPNGVPVCEWDGDFLNSYSPCESSKRSTRSHRKRHHNPKQMDPAKAIRPVPLVTGADRNAIPAIPPKPFTARRARLTSVRFASVDMWIMSGNAPDRDRKFCVGVTTSIVQRNSVCHTSFDRSSFVRHYDTRRIGAEGW
jgi:hypothetical protein